MGLVQDAHSFDGVIGFEMTTASLSHTRSLLLLLSILENGVIISFSIISLAYGTGPRKPGGQIMAFVLND
jgi:hypothetical protein